MLQHSLVNADLFYANLTNTDSRSSLNMYYETKIPSQKRIFFFFTFLLTDSPYLAESDFWLTQLFPRTKSSVNRGVGVHLISTNKVALKLPNFLNCPL